MTKQDEINSETEDRRSVTKPLVICDIDGVLLRFFSAFEDFLSRAGKRFDMKTLTIGPAFPAKDDFSEGDLIQPWVSAFYRTGIDSLEPVEGAAMALLQLAIEFRVILLSNAPASCLPARRRNLSRHGFGAYPLELNQGAKGPAAARLIARDQPEMVFFIDDLGHHVTSVAQHCPPSRRILFNEDQRLARLAGEKGDWHLKTSDWNEVQGFIRTELKTERAQRSRKSHS